MNKRNAVAHETGVIVTGARPGASASKRELFTENTTSVLVFENGGVIRLGTGVTAGQLLFLTHRESKREVVAQVTGTQRFNAGSPYIELEFTEAAPEFWGVEFPNVPELPKTRVEAAATVAPKAAANTDLTYVLEEPIEEPAKAVAGPRGEEVQQLKQEVEALRQQLLAMEQIAKAAPGSSEPAEAAVAGAHGNVPRTKSPSADASMAVEKQEAAFLSVDEEALQASGDSEKAESAAQNLFPEVALDFSKADKAIGRASLEKKKLPGATSGGGTLRLALLGAGLVVAIAGGAWYEGWLPLPILGQAKAGSPAVPVAGRRIVPPVAGAQKTVATDAAAGGAGAAAAANAAGSAGSPVTDSAADGASTERPASSEESARAARSGKTAARDEERRASKAEAMEVSMAAGTGATEPPKLIESVKAIPPRGFVTGNVVLDAVVDTSGRVKSTKVISGPQSLRDAAIDALKKYRYAPAMQNGKAVPGHVQETVQFWYEP